MPDANAPSIPALPPLRPIAEAPIKPGKCFGLCLLQTNPVGWVTGLWDGYGWFTQDHATELQPTSFLLLPS